MFSRKTQSARKSQRPAEYSSWQLPASTEREAELFPSASGAQQIGKMPQKALRGSRTKQPKSHRNPPTTTKLFPSLKVSIAFMDLANL